MHHTHIQLNRYRYQVLGDLPPAERPGGQSGRDDSGEQRTDVGPAPSLFGEGRIETFSDARYGQGQGDQAEGSEEG